MIKAKKTKFALWITTFLLLISCFFGVLALNEQKTAKAEDNVAVTQVQFRTSDDQCFFFLRMAEQTDYTTGNQWHDPSLVSNTNVLDKVTVYFTNASATLREIWTGVNVGTYIWGDDHTLVFPMKSEYVSTNGVGARIESGAEIPMLNGTKKVTNVVRTFWRTGNSDNEVVNNYIDGYNAIHTSVVKVHLRGRLNIGLGEGNDWVKGEGRTDVLPTQVPAADGTTTYSGIYWRKMLACNFLGKVKLHLKETDTWASLGSIMNYNMEVLQLSYYFNGWGETGGTMQLDINPAYNGTTVDKILFEKGCEFPSYDYLGNADAPYTVHVLDQNYLCTSNDMTTADWAVNWDIANPHKVTFNSANPVFVNNGATVDFPADLSETKPGDADYTYIYNWFLNGELYDFSQPVTRDMNLTSDGSFTPILKTKYTLSFENDVETVSPITVTYGEKVGTLPAVPQKVGYDGVWMIEGRLLDSEYEWFIADNATATAVYTPKTYTLSFENGEETITSITVTYGEAVGTLPKVTAKEHYNGAWTLNGEVLDNTYVWNIADNATAVAEYSLASYLVTFNGANAVEIVYGEKISKPTTEPTKESTAEYHYVFDGWYVGDKKWDFETDVVEGNLALVSKFNSEKRTYTVTFNITGKDGLTLAPVTVEYGTAYDLTKLFKDEDTAGYIYSVTVDGMERASVKVVSDVTVDVAFTTPPAAEEEDGGCSGSIAASAVVTLLAAGVALCYKKKED